MNTRFSGGSVSNRENAVPLSKSSFFENKIVSQQSKENAFEGNDWLNLEETALFLRILSRDGSPCKQRIRNLVSQGRVPFYKPFGRLLFKRSELTLLIESSRKGGFKCR